jgi:hypothetical protein
MKAEEARRLANPTDVRGQDKTRHHMRLDAQTKQALTVMHCE